MRRDIYRSIENRHRSKCGAESNDEWCVFYLFIFRAIIHANKNALAHRVFDDNVNETEMELNGFILISINECRQKSNSPFLRHTQYKHICTTIALKISFSRTHTHTPTHIEQLTSCSVYSKTTTKWSEISIKASLRHWWTRMVHHKITYAFCQYHVCIT